MFKLELYNAAVFHNESLWTPFSPANDIEVSNDDPDCLNSNAQENYLPTDNNFELHKFFQAELNDLVRDLSL